MTIGIDQDAAPPALVVGLSIHGLAVARALARQGVDVWCLSEALEPPPPTSETRYARVKFRPTLNTGPLVQYLLEIADEIAAPGKIVLFPTSDRIVRAVAEGWDRLEARYLLSWAHCRRSILALQRKDGLAAACDAAGIRYPRSYVLHSGAGIGEAVSSLRFPLIVKPVQPLSSFKALPVATVDDLARLVERYSAELPFVLQEWIEGDEASLYACTTYLDHGRPVFLFPSRKIAADPPGLGQGTVFETIDDDEVCRLAEHFVRSLDLSGPVAVEFKRDPEGLFWFIEPNVGRTEYCVDLAIQSGWNLPWIEYLHATGRLDAYRAPSRLKSRVWYDTDKDPLCFLRHVRELWRAGGMRPPVFPFLGHSDWRPFLFAIVRRGQRLGRGLRRRAARMAPA